MLGRVDEMLLVKRREAGTLQSFVLEGFAAVHYPGRVPESLRFILLPVLLLITFQLRICPSGFPRCGHCDTSLAELLAC